MVKHPLMPLKAAQRHRQVGRGTDPVAPLMKMTMEARCRSSLTARRVVH